MKKSICILLVLSMMLFLITGCSNKSDNASMVQASSSVIAEVASTMQEEGPKMVAAYDVEAAHIAADGINKIIEQYEKWTPADADSQTQFDVAREQFGGHGIFKYYLAGEEITGEFPIPSEGLRDLYVSSVLDFNYAMMAYKGSNFEEAIKYFSRSNESYPSPEAQQYLDDCQGRTSADLPTPMSVPSDTGQGVYDYQKGNSDSKPSIPSLTPVRKFMTDGLPLVFKKVDKQLIPDSAPLMLQEEVPSAALPADLFGKTFDEIVSICGDDYVLSYWAGILSVVELSYPDGRLPFTVRFIDEANGGYADNRPNDNSVPPTLNGNDLVSEIIIIPDERYIIKINDVLTSTMTLSELRSLQIGKLAQYEDYEDMLFIQVDSGNTRIEYQFMSDPTTEDIIAICIAFEYI